jgi:nucleoside phosphorylase
MLLDASVKDMEAAAIGWVADVSKVPFIALKIVTDIVDGDRLGCCAVSFYSYFYINLCMHVRMYVCTVCMYVCTSFLHGCM